MINSKKLLEIARKGQKVAALGRRRGSFPKTDGATSSSGCTTSLPEKGHFVVYTIDGGRFVLPLAYLDSPILIELFKMSEDEFGLPSGEHIVLPCAGVFLEYAVSLIQRSVSKDVEKALMASMATGWCLRPASLQEGIANQQILLQGF